MPSRAGRLRRVACLILLAALRLGAQSETSGLIALPDLAPDPLAVRLARLVEPLPLDDLVEAALVFSGTPSAALPSYRQRLRGLLERFQRQASAVGDQLILGSRALLFLHGSVLRRYDPLQPRVDTALDDGTYNCVSASVLFLLLGRSVGLAVAGARTVDHVLCTVLTDGGIIDVETTSVYGFDPGTRKEFLDSFGAVTGFAYVPPSNYRDRQPIGEKELLALVLYDRAASAIERGEHSAAVELAVDAWALAGTPLFRSSLTVALTNTAAALGMAGRFEQAIGLLNQAEASFGYDASVAGRRAELVHNWAVELVGTGRLDRADALLASPLAADLDDADLRSLTVWLIEIRAQEPARRSQWQQAADVVADGIARIGSESGLLSAFEAYAHNAFAQLFNAKRFREAKAAVEAALQRHPTSWILKQDLEMASQALRQGGS